MTTGAIDDSDGPRVLAGNLQCGVHGDLTGTRLVSECVDALLVIIVTVVVILIHVVIYV